MEIYYFSSGPRERVFQGLLEAGHHIQELIVTDPERWTKVQPTIELAERAKIPIRIVKRKALKTLGDHLSPKVCLSVGFGYLFPPEFLESMPLCLNVHGTLLPHYGGARTLNWVIENGETESGVTVHKIDTGVDTGPILLQRSFSLSAFDTGASLYRKTLEFEPRVVLEALRMYESGNVSWQEQDHTNVVQYPNRVPEHSEIDPKKPLFTLFNQIRAADPERFPAYFFMNGEKVCLKLWRPQKPVGEEDMI